MMKTISFLYEMSLAIGTSLDIEKNSENFLKILMRRLDLNIAALWLDGGDLAVEGEASDYILAYTYPNSVVKKKSLPKEHQLFQYEGNSQFWESELSLDALNEFITIGDEKKAYSIVYSLGHLGYLFCYAKEEWTKESKTTYVQLKNVMEKFRMSLEACIAYQASVLTTQKNEGLVKAAEAREEAMMAMSTPVAELWEGILLLPLIGGLDKTRSQNVLETVLARISQTEAKAFILDISGIPIIDEYALVQLLKIAKATTLMGCQCLLSGISPSVAQTIVELGIEMDSLLTLGNMKDALNEAFKLVKISLV